MPVQGSLCTKGGEEGARRSNPVVGEHGRGGDASTHCEEGTSQGRSQGVWGRWDAEEHSLFLFFLSNTFKEQCMNSSVSGGVQHFFLF